MNATTKDKRELKTVVITLVLATLLFAAGFVFTKHRSDQWQALSALTIEAAITNAKCKQRGDAAKCAEGERLVVEIDRLVENVDDEQIRAQWLRVKTSMRVRKGVNHGFQ